MDSKETGRAYSLMAHRQEDRPLDGSHKKKKKKKIVSQGHTDEVFYVFVGVFFACFFREEVCVAYAGQLRVPRQR